MALHVEQPAPEEHTQIPVATSSVDGLSVAHSTRLLLSSFWNRLRNQKKSQDSVFDVNRYTENPVPARSGSTSQELRGDPLHETIETENRNKNGEREEVQRKNVA